MVGNAIGKLVGLRRYAHSATAAVYSATLISQLLGLVVAVVTARLLTTTDFGIFTKVAVWTAVIGPLLRMGLPDAALVLASTEKGRAPAVFSAALLISLGFAGMGSVVLCGILVADAVPLGASVAAALSLPVFAASGVALSVEQHAESFGRYNRLLILTNVITVALIGLVGLAGVASVSMMVLVRLLGNAPIVLYQLVRRRNFLVFRHTRKELIAVSRRLVRAGVGFHASGVLALLANRCDQLFAVRYLSPSELAGYGVALTIASGIRPAGNAISTVGIARVAHATNTAVRYTLFRRHVGFGLVAVGALGSCMAGLSYLAIPVLYGDRYAGARAAAVLLCIGVTLAVATEVVIRVSRGGRIVAPGIAARTVGLASAAISAPSLIAMWGLYGAAAVPVISGGLMLLVVVLRTGPKVRSPAHEN